MMKKRLLLCALIASALVLNGCSADDETKIDFGQYASYIEQNDMVKVSFINMSSVTYSDNTSDVTFDKRIESTINLHTKEETTIDYTDCYQQDGSFDESLKKEVDFDKVFKFEISDGENIEEIINQFLAKEGYNEDLEDSEWNEELSEANDLDAYVFNNHCKVENTLKPQGRYDELLRKETYYIENEEGIPLNFCAVLQYKKGDDLYTKSSLLRIEFYNAAEETAANEE